MRAVQRDTLPKGKVSQMACPKGRKLPTGWQKTGPAYADPLESLVASVNVV